MKNKNLFLAKLLIWCIGIGVFTSCQNDDQNDPTPLSQEDYVTYESNLLTHLRHFGEQIRNNSLLDFDDESLKSISSSYFEGDDHAAFVAAIDDPSTEQLPEILQRKVNDLHAATDDYDDHADYLSYLGDQFNLEFESTELTIEDKAKLLNHIVHLRVATQFLEEHQDLFLSSTDGGRVADVDWWLVSGKCALKALGADVSQGVDNVSTLDQSTTSAKVLSAMRDAKQNCNSKLFLTAFDFFVGLSTNPYCANTPCDETSVYNMYSYGYLNNAGIVPDNNPPVEDLTDFPLPSGDLDTILTNVAALEGPYIGKTADDKHFAMTDCSGFVSYILKRTNSTAYGEIFKTVQNGMNKGISHLSYCPSASQYANFDAGSSQKWSYVGSNENPDFSSIQAGDIIAWDEAPDDDGDTGHVMIAAGPSREADNGCFYLVDIFDSTLDAHLDNDRSGIKNGNDPSGVGLGTIGLKVLVGSNELQSNFYPTRTDCFAGTDSWNTHPIITILRISSN